MKNDAADNPPIKNTERKTVVKKLLADLRASWGYADRRLRLQ